MSEKETMPYSDKILFVMNAADIPNPFGRSVKYSSEIARVNLDGEYEYRVQLRLQGKNKNKFATIVYGDFSDLESATKAGKEILTAFRRRRKIETYIMVENKK